MLKSDFQAHPLWDTISSVADLGDALRENVSNIERRSLDRIRELLMFSQAVKPLGVNHARRFNQVLLDALHDPWAAVLSSLQSRKANVNPAYTDQAVSYAEATLQPLYSLWVPPLAPAQQAQMRSFYEELLARQDDDISRLRDKRDALSDRFEELGTESEDRFAAAKIAFEELQGNAAQVGETVDGYETRVDAIVDDGSKRISALESENTKSYANWQQAQRERFEEDFAPFMEHIKQKLLEADGTLQSLRETNKEYKTLTAAAAADKLAQSFSQEAKSTRRVGLILYGIGFVLLTGAAIPLIFLLAQSETPAGESLWATFAVRATIGALAASAATVAIRLGSRFISSGQESKRTELELRAFGPFLSNVDKSESDTARLEFVERAFGSRTVEDRNDDAIPVSTFSQILAAVTKLMGR
ncbi:hypothetical protein CMMCAS08_11090 [Clavibacter michiganensis subsp. michiganensis]|uniref:hypothetical protein n=1 Tax=Clavibacter michiganensis TaxID=28447 RepID=UPI000B667EC6|nr:hypothetical protein [Clavibacter michiganensis]OUD90600.1 hypothetical protein CMMCAS05_11335 [Clavibacter michiganensis subsp. michiganensis]OUE03289.1 hypothetical protein CMMCAS08_11090 [Clavibacter michiganensis subsp. michiganensis]OUE11556.1 hypothetical protein CMMCAY01_01000 [Clavibacter michiganensis subsp. michiganensis]UOW03885.1 hypothetical protein MU580_01030 [Clavibacter michiganensis subsp. michiganensis]